MLRNYLVVAYRSLRRHLGSTLLNVAGLAIGIAVCLLFGALAWSLLTWDSFHPEADRLYLVHAPIKTSGGWERASDTWGATLRDLKRTFPAVETGTRVWSVGQRVTPDRATEAGPSGAPRHSFEESVDYVDSTFFQVMGFRLKKGDPATVLDRPNAAVLTQKKARAYFGEKNPIGKTLTLDGQSTVTVTGVAHNPPENTNVRTDVMVNIAHARIHDVGRVPGSLTEWAGSFLNTYVRLRENADPEQLEAQLNDGFLVQRIGPQKAKQRQMGLIGIAEVSDQWMNANIYAYLVLAIALGILGLAAINVTNLATARSLERAREIGVRKALGARREGLAGQFLVEAQLLAFAALGVGVVAGQVLLPSFGAFVELNMQFDWFDPRLWAALGGLGVLVGVMAGGYPAFVLSRFQPSETLRGNLAARPGGQRLRRVLVGGQFALAIVLVAGTFGIQRQITYMQRQVSDLHLDRITWTEVRSDHFDDPEAGRRQLTTLQQELERSSAVAEASVSSVVPGRYYIGTGIRTAPEGKTYMVRRARIDTGYFDTYDLQITAGHGFADATAAERDSGIVVNRATVQAMGWDSIRGKALYDDENQSEQYPVIGVVEDFHFKSLREPIKPAIHYFAGTDDTSYGYVSVRAAGPIDDAIRRTRETWDAVGIPMPFDYSVAGDQFSGVGTIDRKMGTLISYAALLALLIAAMGLFGIASLSVSQREKEIGVRKALGASVSRIAWLLSSQFAKLVLGAAVVALPLAYWAVQQWLRGFAYRVDLPGWTFALAGLAVMGVALLTVATQVVRAARLDPATTLRDE